MLGFIVRLFVLVHKVRDVWVWLPILHRFVVLSLKSSNTSGAIFICKTSTKKYFVCISKALILDTLILTTLLLGVYETLLFEYYREYTVEPP